MVELTIDQLLSTAKNVTVPISKLKAAKYNPRKNLKPEDPEYQAIKRSVLTYGVVEDVIINSDYTIINGHQRTKIYKDLGLKEIPCKMLDLDKNMEKAANLMLNKAQGQFDYDMVALSLADLAANDISNELTGFSDDETQALLASIEVNTQQLEQEPEQSAEEEKEEKKGTELKTIYLAIGKERIPISGEEHDGLINLVKEYTEVYDSPIGFVSWLLNNVGHRP